MPVIDVYAPAGAFADKSQLARSLAAAVMVVEKVSDIPMFRENTAVFIHELLHDAISNVDGGADYVRVQVLTNAGALDRDKQIALVERLTGPGLGRTGKPAAAGADMGAAHRGSRRRLGSVGFRAHQRRTDRGSAQPDGRCRGGCAGGAQRRGA